MGDDRNFDDVAAFTRAGAAGDVIFSEGDSSTELFLVQDGRIELVRGPAAIAIGMVEAGDIFGEWSFFENQPREMTARAVADFRVIAFDRAAFDRITAEAPDVAAWMLHKLARRLHALMPPDSATPARPLPGVARAPGTAVKAPAPAPTASAGPGVLVEVTSGTRFPLASPEMVVGRADRATGFKPEIDLSDLDPERTLSRRHAKIVRRGAGYFVREDSGSRNGTFVNDQRIAPGTDVELHNGDEVLFGLVKTTFHRQ